MRGKLISGSDKGKRKVDGVVVASIEGEVMGKNKSE